MSYTIQANTFPYYTELHSRRRWAPFLAGGVPALVVVIQELYSLLAIVLYLGPWLFWSARDYAMGKLP